MKIKWHQDLKRILGLKYEVNYNLGDILKCKHKDILDPIFIMIVSNEEFVIYGIDDIITTVEGCEVYNKNQMKYSFEKFEVVCGE
jgi:hypothetical protein